MTDRITNTVNDILSVESLHELDVYRKEIETTELNENVEVLAAFEKKAAALMAIDPQDEIARLRAQIEALKSAKTIKPKADRLPRVPNKYRILSTSTHWAGAKAHQIHALGRILHSNCRIGQIYDEPTILSILEKNRTLFRTVQDVKLIWNFYKGDWAKGFTAHKMIELVIDNDDAVIVD